MLIEEACETTYAVLLYPGYCPGGVSADYHRVVIPVGADFTFDRDNTELEGQLVCSCGKSFDAPSENRSVMTSRVKYTNPVTGVSGPNVGTVASAGAMWRCGYLIGTDVDGNPRASSFLSRFYRDNWLGKRDPLCVRLPNGRDWIIDAKADNGEGWSVTGNAPNITCSPSIHAGDYHSFLVNGVLGEDTNCRHP